MRRRKLCELEVVLDIDAEGPVLVKSGRESGLFGVDMCFVRTRRGNHESDEGDPFLPGTSLKGVFRSHAERLVRTLAGRDDAVCLPYLQRPERRDEQSLTSCGKRLEKVGQEDKSIAYARSCLACRLFGSLAFGGRIAISDGYLVDREEVPLRLEVRDGVAIDRRTGAVAGGAKFQFEVLTQGRFRTRILLDNYESWQAGVLVAVLEDFVAGRIPIGMGTSRGLGRVRGTVREVRGRWYGNDPGGWKGIERLLPADDVDRWSLRSGPGDPPAVDELKRSGLALEVTTSWDEWGTAREFFLGEFTAVAREDDWPRRASA